MRSTVSDSGNGDSEVQRTMLELLNQLDGFEALNKIKVLMAINRIDILDQALLRPRRMDRKIEFPNPSEDENHDSSLLPLLERNQPIIRGSNNSGNVIAPSPAELLSAPGVYQNRTGKLPMNTISDSILGQSAAKPLLAAEAEAFGNEFLEFPLLSYSMNKSWLMLTHFI